MSITQKHPTLSEFAVARDEAVFAKVVGEFGGLVFTSALRRTGDCGLAEEVAQNVFTIAARKAKRLAVHPALTGWFYTTVKLEAAKALRGRQRHNRKIEALTEEMKSHASTTPTTMSAEEQDRWRDALPLLDESLDRLSATDRQIVLGRFFEGRSFKEIAETNGRSEAACKMRLKRTLGKLNGWLSGRGVTLSATALASALGSEFSKAAPTEVAASIPAQAIAASPGLGTATILTNTLNTMSTIKSTSIAAIAILAFGAVPVAMQHSQAKHLEAALTSLQERAAEQDADPQRSIHRRQAVGNAPGAGNSATRPVARFLADMDRPIVVDELIEQIVSAAMSRDMAKIMRVLMPLAKLTPEQGQQLLVDVRASKKSLQMKEIAMQMLPMMVHQPEGSPGESLDRNLGSGVSPMNLSNHLGAWAKKDPDAAIAWFVSRRDAGALAGKGVHENPEAQLLTGLLDGLAQTDPQRAIAFLDGAAAETRAAGIQSMAGRLAVNEATRDQALSLVKSIASESERAQAAESAASTLSRRGMLDEAADFVHGSNLSDGRVAAAIARAAVARSGESAPRSWAERVAWATENSPPGARKELIRELAQQGHHYYPPNEISQWVDAMPPGAERDAGLAAETGALSMKDQPEQALERAQGIGDQAVRDDAIKRVVIWVNHRSAEAATQLAIDHGLDLENILPKKANR